MAAIAVTTANTNIFQNGNRVMVRTSAGIPYILVKHSITTFELRKGNSSTPTSFSSAGIDSTSVITCGLAMAIDSNNIIHISWIDDIGASSDLKYRTFDTSNDTFGTLTIINADIGGDPDNSAVHTAIAIDSNNFPHIAYTSYPSISGGATYATHYTNKITGSWITAIQVLHTKNLQTSGVDLAIDMDDLPVISTCSYTNTSNGLTAYKGNLNNPTNFSASSFILNASTLMKYSTICIAPNGDCYIASTAAINSSATLYVYKHAYLDAWNTWTTMNYTIANSVVRETPLSLTWADKLYLFFEDAYDNDIKYISHDGSSWSTIATLETGSFNNARTKWGFWVNNDSTGDLLSYGAETALTSQLSSNGYLVLATSNSTRIGQSFNGSDSKLTKATFYLKKVGTPGAGNVTASLYSHSGVFGTSSIALNLIASSTNSIAATSISTSASLYDFTFGNVRLQSGFNYVIVVNYSGTSDSSNHIGVNCNTTASSHAGNVCNYYNSTWTAVAYDLVFVINVQPITYRKPNEIDYAFTDETASSDILFNMLLLSTWTTKSLKWYNGSSWVAKPLKYYNGSIWVTKPLKASL